MYDAVPGPLRDEDEGVDPRIRHEVGETSTLIALVADRLGAAVVPEPVAAMDLASVAYRPVVRAAATVALAVTHRSTASSRTCPERSTSSGGRPGAAVRHGVPVSVTPISGTFLFHVIKVTYVSVRRERYALVPGPRLSR